VAPARPLGHDAPDLGAVHLAVYERLVD
jgi:hypothetical protein